jgi:hypothetical protein
VSVAYDLVVIGSGRNAPTLAEAHKVAALDGLNRL